MSALLEIHDLEVVFETDRGLVRAVNGLSLSIQAGETLGLVGESGCGKTVTGMSVMRLLPCPPGRITGGSIRLDGEDLLGLSEERMRKLRGSKLGMVFQDPLSALNPVLRVGAQLTELIRAHTSQRSMQARRRVLEAFSEVGLPDPGRVFEAYPYQLSGGMRQRALIAMAFLLHPALIIADEPTTALDVTVQAQIIALCQKLKAQYRMTMLLISHDLGVVAQLADRIGVMYAGKLVEEAPTRKLLTTPRHPYTKGLLEALPARRRDGALPQAIPGSVPNPVALPSGCPFHPRCARVQDRCKSDYPNTSSFGEGHRGACHNPEPEADHGSA